MTDTRLDEFVLQINSEKYLVAEDRNGVRQFKSTRVSTQGNIPLDEQSYSLADFSEGSGYSFERPGLGVYAEAEGWDATSPGNLGTWPRLAVCESFTTEDAPGDALQVGLYLYVGRGRYVCKYVLNDTVGSTWSIAEYHDLGSGNTLAGRPVVFQGKGYFPVRAGTTGALTEFHELDTTNSTVVESQTIAISGTPTAGTYTITYDGKTTAAIAFNAAASVVQAALRLVPGMANVTVTATGTIPNFTHTVVMTGVGAGNGLTSPAQMTSTDSTTGGTHAIAHATTVAGTTDRWDVADSTLEFGGFCVWKEQLRAFAGNRIYSCSVTPTTAANWNPAIGSGYVVGDSGQDITELFTYPLPDMLMVCKTDGLWSFTEGLQTRNELPSIRAVIDSRNGRYAALSNGYGLMPHASGLIRWRPGAYQFVGPEQDGSLEGAISEGWGRATGIAVHGRKTYIGINDSRAGDAHLISLDEPRPGQQRSPLVPHTHQRIADASIEGVAVISTQQQPAAPRTPVTFSDDSAVGTITWADTANAAALDGAYVTAAAGTSHYLKALNPSNAIPTGATVLGVLVEVAKKAGGSLSFTPESHVGGIYSSNATYLTARSGSGLVASDGAGTPSFGQGRSGATYFCTETFFEFDTSSIPDTATVLSATLTVTLAGQTGHIDGTVAQARLYDFGATVTTGDWIAGASLGAQTLLATAPITNLTNNFSATIFTAESAFAANVNKTGTTRIVLCTDTQVAGTAPSDGNSGPIVSAFGTANVNTLTVTYTSGTVDNVVKLVVGGSVVGSNLADTVTNWPTDIAYSSYGGATNLWGLTPSVADVNGSTFGVVISATVATNDTASIDHIRMTTYYSVPGASDPSTFVTVMTVDATRTICTPYIYKLPRSGLTAVTDPNINRQVSSAVFSTSRYFHPSRNVKKVYRAVEEWLDLDPETNTPGYQIWASVDECTAFQLLDENGSVKTVTTTGRHRFFFPPTSSSIGHFVQLEIRVPATTGGQVGVAANVRDARLYYALMPSRADRCEMTVVLGDGEFEDGTSMRRTIAQQRSDLQALADPAAAPITFHDPVTRANGYLRVEECSFGEGVFRGYEQPVQVAHLRIFKALYDDAN